MAEENIPPELREGLEKMFPGFKIRHINDIDPGELPPEIVAEADQKRAEIMAEALDSLIEGKCYDCGKKYPGEWPPPDGVPMVDGWGVYFDEKDEPAMLVCPCDEDENEDNSIS